MAIALGLALSFFAFRYFVSKPEIGIIKVYGPILYQYEADQVNDQIQYARDRKEIKGVVLEIDCAGGEASLIQEVYFNLLHLREQKPVVASVNRQATSGGYYLAIAANHIYAKPDSILASIGAWAALPYPEIVMEDILPTGPFKDTGMTRRKAVDHLEMLRQTFLGAVLFHRGDHLQLGAQELGRAEVYVGLEGLRYGLVDQLGSGMEAADTAAGLAGISHYQVTDISQKLSEEVLPLDLFEDEFFRQAGRDTPERTLLPTYYYLMERLPAWEE